MRILHSDPRLSWPGSVSLEQTDSFTRPWRIPFSRKTLFHPQLLEKASKSAGVRIAFGSSTTRIAGKFHRIETENPKLNLCVDGKLFETIDLTDATEFSCAGLPSGDKRLELWLPQFADFFLEHLEIDDNASLAVQQDDRPRWITYGSSITHCRSAQSPTLTWPAIVARDQDLNLTSLGFGGECHLDIQIARLIRDLPADAISICAGINIYGRGSLSARSFAQNLIASVEIIREKHPDTPLLLISPIYGCERETNPNACSMTLADYRAQVRETAELFQKLGDSHLHYLDGLELFGESLAQHLPDNLHPSAEGYQIMGENFLKLGSPLIHK
ncbi:SGNH/GDSL hydrolase family protein [Puniceicoccus vermicola]|uniref:GDSL family lipase n=1 Tax=Puniceicoccus vermicola TaxID=388746 RepID=A0A7X1AYP9_9BACT|nr:SGNH/GDSL hydrolase family protein [Puniceicoccus vermicola]MBC2601275.1 GDSL family lipase [Puniceicoccus vermicola]